MRILVALFVVALVLGMAFSHDASAAPAPKVDICHLNSSNTSATYHYEFEYVGYYTYVFDATYAFGNVISVNQNAVAAHEAHGDSTIYYPMSAGLETTFETWDASDISYSDPFFNYSIDYGNGNVVNSDCYVYSYTYSYTYP